MSVVNSYTVKGDGTLSEDPERAFCDWLHSFNYAVRQRDEANFLWVLYEEFRLNENHAIAARMADFLQIGADFDLGEIESGGKKIEPQFLGSPSGEATFEAITHLFDIEHWVEDVEAKMSAGKLLGYPLADGEKIDLTVNGNAWKYVFDGFYAPELDGSWTQGGESVVCFTPQRPLSGRLCITLDISWSLGLQGVGTAFSVYLDDMLIGDASLLLEKSNGESNLVILCSPEFVQRSPSITLKIIVSNPRNPALLGVSADNRDLGIMIRSISVSC